MQLSKSDISIIKKQESKFVSLKFTDNEGGLKQIDLSAQNINQFTPIIIDGEFCNLNPIFSFKDPFRSQATTSIFCENLSLAPNFRKLLSEQNDKMMANQKLPIEIYLSFWLDNSDFTSQEGADYLCCSDPKDKFADLRTDIISTLESISIETTYHLHGKTHNECIIGVRANNFLNIADSIITLKYIISNVAIGYGLNALFGANQRPNIEIRIAQEDLLVNKFIENMSDKAKHNTQIITLGLIRFKNSFNTEKEYLRIQLSEKEIFNPYFSIFSLLT